MDELYADLALERKELVKDMLRSPAWDVFMNEIVQPVREQILVGLRELKPSTQADGPVLAAQIKLLDRLFYNVGDYL